MNIEKQRKRVSILTEMMIEELEDYLDKQYKYEVWQKKDEPRDYHNYPDTPNAASLKRIMLMVRKETIKMEKLI